MINFYKTIKTSIPIKINKPTGIELPFRMIVASASGTGKTNSILNLLVHMNKMFNRIIICTKSNENLYELLIDKLNKKDKFVQLLENEIPEMDDDHKLSKLIIFDDLMLENDAIQKKITQYYIRGRKKNYSCIYISQSYYQIPKNIRKNMGYAILGGGLLNRDLNLILSEFPSRLSKDEFVKLYNYYSSKKLDVILIDILNHKIKHNLINDVSNF